MAQISTPLYSPLVSKDGFVHSSAWLEWFNRLNMVMNSSSITGALLAANNLSDVASASTSRTNIGLGATNEPSFKGLTLSGLTPSEMIATDGSGKLVSVTSAILAALLGFGPTSTPTFAGLKLDNLNGILRGNFGIVDIITIGPSLQYNGTTLDAIQDFRVSASPTFVDLTLSGLSVSKVVVSNGSKALISGSNTDTEIASAVTLKHNRQHALDATADHTIGGLTSTYLVKSDGSKLVSATNTDSDVASAVGASHVRLHDLDSISDHTGIAGTPGNLMVLDANGLPTDGGAVPSGGGGASLSRIWMGF